MKLSFLFGCMVGTLALAGCVSSPNPTGNSAVAHPEANTELAQLQEKPFVFAVLEYLYRWHFDQSYVLAAGKVDALEIWVRPIYPTLDAGDHSEYAEMWIPAVNTCVELKRADYKIPEMNLAIESLLQGRSRDPATQSARLPLSLPGEQLRPGGGAGLLV